jgi:hypothetical protein
MDPAGSVLKTGRARRGDSTWPVSSFVAFGSDLLGTALMEAYYGVVMLNGGWPACSS